MIRPADRIVPEARTPGMHREQAKIGDGFWMGLHIPKGAIHREGSASGSQGVEGILFRVGTGQVLFNVEAPEEG